MWLTTKNLTSETTFAMLHVTTTNNDEADGGAGLKINGVTTAANE